MRTHLAFAVMSVLLLIDDVNNKVVFAVVALACCLLPDIDCMHSYLGRRWFFRPLQWCVKHRNVLHSFTFVIIVSGIFAIFFLPVLALPFFVGYAGHLMLDSLTAEGIRPFWPSKQQISGGIRTGGKIEIGLFYFFIIVSVVLFVGLFN